MLENDDENFKTFYRMLFSFLAYTAILLQKRAKLVKVKKKTNSREIASKINNHLALINLQII